jgi:Peptidase family M23/WD40-like Beta Propeller Repeat
MFGIAMLGVIVVGLASMPTPAQSAPVDKPFRFPLAGAPGPNSWLLGQHYGNTVEAATFGRFWYVAGQGLHFGLDLEAPCGTPVFAAADGQVDWVNNGTFGAGPNNLVLQHPQLGYSTVYGHLQERPLFQKGDLVTDGQIIGVVGDPDLTCQSRPHLHFEVRSPDQRTIFNPATLLSIDWDLLALTAEPLGIQFALLRGDPRRWVRWADQPVIQTYGNLVNQNMAFPVSLQFSPPPQTLPGFTSTAIGNVENIRLGQAGCCVLPFWFGQSLRYIDRGSEGPAVWEFSTSGRAVVADRLPSPLLSPDGKHTVRVEEVGQTWVRNSQGQTWLIDTRGSWPVFSPDGKFLLWQVRASVYFPESLPLTEIWVSDLAGESPRLVRTLRGGNVRWLDSKRLLLIEGTNKSQQQTMSIYNLSTDVETNLGIFNFLRAVQVAPGGGHISFMVPFQDDPAKAGLYIMATSANAIPQKLPFFGSIRWRDATSLFYLEDPRALYVFNIATSTSQLITDQLAVYNADWVAAPDGQSIAYVNAQDGAIWLVRLLAPVSPSPTPFDF